MRLLWVPSKAPHLKVGAQLVLAPRAEANQIATNIVTGDKDSGGQKAEVRRCRDGMVGTKSWTVRKPKLDDAVTA